MNQSKRIAIIADWLIDFGGAELVLSHLLEMYPEADIYTSVCYMDHPMLEGRKVITSWIQKIPYLNRKHKLAGLLRPWAFRSFDLSEYDVIISSSSAESKNAGYTKRKEGAKHICYCHTPIRYYWSHAKEYEDMMEFGALNPLVKFVFRLVKGWMQGVDYRAAQKVDFFIANSKNTAERIHKYYHREAEVIYPGVEIPLLKSNTISVIPSITRDLPIGNKADSSLHSEGQEQIDSVLGTEGQKQRADSSLRSEGQGGMQGQENDTETSSRGQKFDYYLGLGRCIPYKKFDLLVDTFNENGKKLILCTATDTKLYRELREKSKPNIEWKFRVSNEEKIGLMQNARAFLFPPEEDFGLVPVEAMMAGTPVIAYGKGGATESIVEGETGLFFDPQTSEALNKSIVEFEKREWDRKVIEHLATRFSKEEFKNKFSRFIKDTLNKE